MSGKRGPLWYWMNDPDDRVAEMERGLDRLDIEIDGLQRLRFERNRERLERLGIDSSRYKEMPPMHASELRCTNHLRNDTDIEALVIAATESPLDRMYREHLARKAANEKTIDTGGQTIIRRGIGQVLGVR